MEPGFAAWSDSQLLAIREHDWSDGSVIRTLNVVSGTKDYIYGLVDKTTGNAVATFEFTPLGEVSAIDSSDHLLLKNPVAYFPVLSNTTYAEWEMLGSGTGLWTYKYQFHGFIPRHAH